MKRPGLSGIDPAGLADAVGSGAYARGLLYYRQGAVGTLWWDPAESALHATVRGRTAEFYNTAAYFLVADGRPPQFEHGRCSCPVGFNCKHVVALVLAGTGDEPAGVPEPLAPRATASLGVVRAGSAATVPAPRPAEPESWDTSLDSMLAVPAGGSVTPGTIPLAVTLTLTGASLAGPGVNNSGLPGGSPARLLARLVQPGKSGWITGQLGWSRLDHLNFAGDYAAPQIRLLRELYALYQCGTGQLIGYGSRGDEKTIDLTAFESPQLWPLLDRAREAGIRLLYGRDGGVLTPGGPLRLCLDVTRPEPSGPLQVAPVIRPDGPDSEAAGTGLVPLAFIGLDGHGLVYTAPGTSAAPFLLAPLAHGVPHRLQHLALAGQRLEVPAAEQARFRDAYYPRLRQAATIVSSDGAFTPPRISGPVLVLRARYAPGHQVDVSWCWAYQVGDAQVHATLWPDPADGYRDIDAERGLLAALDLPLTRFGVPHPGDQAGGLSGGPVPATRLNAIATMLFTTELLPLAGSHPGVRVEVTGEPASYLAADDDLQIGLTTDEVAGDGDWFDLGVTITAAGHLIPFTDLFVALTAGDPYLLLPDGTYFSLDKPELAALARLIAEARALHESPGESLRISRFQAGLWGELAELGVVNRQAGAWRRQVEGLLSAGAGADQEPPAGLLATLRPYQLTGFQWLAFLWQHQLGGILADDMGLGKTLQALALICHARQAAPDQPPFLIVAPTSVVSNWAAEAARFAPGLTVVPVTETAARRGTPLSELTEGADAVVTSYALLRIDIDSYAADSWSGLLLDEAQQVKNHQSRVYQCARRVAAPVKIAITGTPMENNLMELWALLSITAPGLFPQPGRFRDFYARPIEQQGRAELLAQLRQRIRPLVMRRTKEQVAPDLPAKQEQVLEVELHPRHRRVYQTYLQRERQKVLRLIEDMDANRFTILKSLTLLRQLSLHAGLVDDEHAALPSAKIDALLDQLGGLTQGGHRALVFSQFTGFLRKVAERLDEAGVAYCYLDGSTRDRAGAVQEFRDGSAPVFLISLKAGGFGLNLTEADYCFLLDPWWNPATEAQAIDRTHRIGQVRNVMVYRLIAAGTIEDKVLALQARKAELFASVMDAGGTFGTALTPDDIRALLD